LAFFMNSIMDTTFVIAMLWKLDPHSATLFASPKVASSGDSRTPFRRPSITGRIPILGK
jgi:hypothetical protein